MKPWMLLAALGIGCHAPVLQVKTIDDATRLAYYTAEGGIVLKHGDNTCVAPPAQAARAVSGDANAAVTGAMSEVTGGVEAGGTRTHDVVQLHDLHTSMQLLEHGLYRLCEAKVNGFLTEDEDYKAAFDKIVDAARALAEKEAEIAKASAVAARASADREAERTEQVRLRTNPAMKE